MSRVLLHTCCAPCTTYVFQWLMGKGDEVRGLFYNPNIRPPEEYARRLDTMETYSSIVGLKVINLPLEKGETQRGLIPGDCENCYRVRLTRTADRAKKLAYEYFSTTLLISPFQKHELIKQVGEEVAASAGVKFFYQDFRIGYNQSRQMSRELGLYRQKYCGCGFDLKVKKEKHDAEVSQPA